MTGRRHRKHIFGWSRDEVLQKIRRHETTSSQRSKARSAPSNAAGTLGEWARLWLKDVHDTLQPRTWQGYESHLRVHILPRFGARKMTRITTADINDFLRHLLADKPHGAGLDRGSVESVRRTLSVCFNRAVASELTALVTSPVKGSHLPAQATARHEITPFTARETRALLALADAEDDDPARWWAALLLGLRQGEALGLQWTDVDFELSDVHVRRSLYRIPYQHGCGDPAACARDRCARKLRNDPRASPCEPGCVRHASSCPQRIGGLGTKPPKSKAGTRVVTMPDPVRDAFSKQLAASRRAAMASGTPWEPSRFVFSHPDGRPYDPAYDWSRFKALLARAGVADRRLHDCRHTAATGMLSAGLDTVTLLQVMGWSSHSLAVRYTHLIDRARKQAAAASVRWLADNDDDDPDVVTLRSIR
ncbi:site-specific integrase [Intrasporangium mesophilum]